MKNITITPKELPVDADPQKPKYELVTSYFVEFVFPVYDNIEFKSQAFQTNSIEDKEQIDFEFEMTISNLPIDTHMRDFLMKPFACTVVRQQVEKIVRTTTPAKADAKGKKPAPPLPVEEKNYPEEQNRREEEIGKAYFDLRGLLEGNHQLSMESNVEDILLHHNAKTASIVPCIALSIVSEG